MFLVEFSEDGEGNETIDKIGFLRVSKSANNKDDKTALSTAKQFYGGSGDVGSVIMEHPRLGIDTRLRVGLKSGLNVEEAHTFEFINGVAENALMMGLDFSYNLAPIIGVSQTFLDFGFGFGILDAPLDGDVDGIPLLIDAGLGFSKKIWFGRMSIPFGVAAKYQSLNLNGTNTGTWSFGTGGVSATVGFELMVNADIVLHVGAEYNFAGPMAVITYTDEDDNVYDISDLGYQDNWNNDGASVYNFLNGEYYYADEAMNLGGLSLRVGIDYSLGSLPIDIFGFLDPYKKY